MKRLKHAARAFLYFIFLFIFGIFPLSAWAFYKLSAFFDWIDEHIVEILANGWFDIVDWLVPIDEEDS